MRSKKLFCAARSIFVIFVTLLMASIVVLAQTQETKFEVLHTFHGKDGVNPIGQLVLDAVGNIYGTTGEGGSGKCENFGCGTAFKMSKTGKVLWQYSFSGANGRAPLAGLLRDKSGNLYGTAGYGGKINNHICPDGEACGVVFELNATGKEERVLHKFAGPPDGYFPQALLVGEAGSLYGTTYLGGDDEWGTVFEVDGIGKETILHSFAGPPDGGGDGAYVYTGVIRDAAGNLYGVTDAGGAYCCGTVYKIDSYGNETLLYSFTGYSDGDGPDSVLVADSAGNLYGTTEAGGNGECGGSGCGVVFELSPHSDGSWTESVLYVFCSLSNCVDGSLPWKGPLVRDANGNLYGTTMWGGTSRCNGSGCGVVFKLDMTGKETVLHSFGDEPDGAYPYSGLTMDSSGNLYGAALQGGDLTCKIGNGQGCGTLFKITRSGGP
jgi:uncharacterized repeat protein (TIGR03803 family)